MSTTYLKNSVSIDVTASAVGLHVKGTAAAPTASGGIQPQHTLRVEGATGQETTGSGQIAGVGANVSITAGTGGIAPAGSTNGAGGSVIINPGPAGAGAGTAAVSGSVLLATAGGNVAVGTTTADISGIGSSAATLTVLKTGGRGNLELATNVDSNGASVGTVTFTNSTQSTSAKRVAEIRGLEEGTTAFNRGGRLTFGTRTNGANDVTTRLIIDQKGYVALGNYTPAADLDITKDESGNRTELRISNLSNTAASRAFLDLRVGGTSAGSPVVNFAVTSALCWAAGVDNADGRKFKINWTDSSSLNDNFAGTNVLTLLGSGNVGIGTTAPGSKLHVGGGVQVGAPTGGDKGTGSINVSGDIYKNGTPQGLFEHHHLLERKLTEAQQRIEELTERLARLEAASGKERK